MKKFLLLANLFSSISCFSQPNPDIKLELFFGVNKSALNKQHLKLIDSAIISKNLVTIAIKGFADSTGNASYNMDLSKRRAWSVFQYFTSHHYSDSISIQYFGEQTAAGSEMSYDRRVEIWVIQRVAEKVTAAEQKIQADTLAIIERYELTNIYFIPDKALVDPASFFAVDDAAKYLKHFPGCKFEIVGHVNYILPASVMNNPEALEPVMKLSEERAKTVYQLFAERDIPIESMTYKGAGNSQMVFKNPENEKEKRKNMRVEVLISCKK